MDKLLGFYLPGIDKPGRARILWGITGALSVYAGLVLIYILFSPPLISGDETSHLDYVWLVYNHHLPNFVVGVHLPFSGVPFPPVQWVVQHPPLFYVLLAPFVGPLLATKHALAAILAGRLISAFFGAMSILLVPFFINRWGMRRKEILVLSALLTAAVVPLVGVSGAIYNDSLGTLISTISVGIIGLIVIRGPNRKYIVALAASLALGLLTRSLLAVNLVIGCAAIIIGYYNHRGPNEGRFDWLNKGVFASMLVSAAAIAASGWYYWRNYSNSGSIFGSQGNWAVEHMGRMVYSVHAIVDKKVFQELPLSLFSNRSGFFNLAFVSTITHVLSFVLIVTGFFFIIRKLRGKDRLDKGLAVMAGLGALSLFISMVLQAKFAAQGGSINARYLLQCAFFIVFIISFGAYRLGILGRIAAFALALGGMFSIVDNVMRSTSGKFVIVNNNALKFPISQAGASWLAGICLALMAVGLLACLWSVFVKPGPPKPRLFTQP